MKKIPSWRECYNCVCQNCKERDKTCTICEKCIISWKKFNRTEPDGWYKVCIKNDTEENEED